MTSGCPGGKVQVGSRWQTRNGIGQRPLSRGAGGLAWNGLGSQRPGCKRLGWNGFRWSGFRRDGLGQHISKNYIYFAMGFSVFVEMINIRVRKKGTPVDLH